MMRNRRLLFPVALVLSLVVAGLGVYRQVDAHRSGDADPVSAAPVLRLAPTPLTVSLGIAHAGVTGAAAKIAAVGVVTPVAVNVAGPVISEVRLYDGDSLIGIQRFAPHRTGRVSVLVPWPVLRPGAHVLHAQATAGTPDQVGHSAPLRLTAVRPVVTPATIELPANGRTPRQVAASAGVPVRALGDAARPKVRLSAVGPATATEDLRADAAAPEVSLDGCRASVRPAPGGAGRFEVYELTGGGPGFVARGTVTSSAPLRTGELTPGPHVFVTGPAGRPASSDPVSVDVPARCLSTQWSGRARLLDGELTLPSAEPRVWIYLGVDGKPFQRIPAVGTVGAGFGSVDLAGSIPSLRGRTVQMEVWRPGASDGAAATLVDRSALTLSDPDALAGLVGSNAGVTLYSPGGSPTYELGATTTSVRFSWSTENLATTGVVWQVLGRPLAADDRNTAPPVLLATGSSADGDGPGIQLSGRGGSFEIPAEMLLAGRRSDEPTTDVLRKVPTPTLGALLTPGSQFGAQPVVAPEPGAALELGAGLVPIPVGDVYVRLLPLHGQTVTGDASNTVAVTLPDLAAGPVGFRVTKVDFDPGVAANPELLRCIRVTGTSAAAHTLTYPEDGTYCPVDFAGRGGGCRGWCQVAADLASLTSFVGKAWDYIASAYNTAVDTVIDVIARFNPFCLTASVASAISASPYASKAADGCSAIGQVVASVVVSALLSSVGLPAKLPSSAQLAAIAEGDIAVLAEAYLEQLGVPCSKMTLDPATVSTVKATGVSTPAGIEDAAGGVDVCAAMIGQAAAAIRSQIKAAADSEITNLTGLPAPPAPATMQLEPRGRYAGAVVHLEAVPIDAQAPKTARCAVAARGAVPSWNVGGFEGTKVRSIGYGAGTITHRPFGALLGKPWAADVELPPVDDLYAFETIAVTLSSSCVAAGGLTAIPPTPLGAPLGRWHP